MRKLLTCFALFALTGLFFGCGGSSEEAGTTIVVQEPAAGAELKPAPAPVFMESEFDDEVELDGDVDIDTDVDEAEYEIEIDD